MNLALSNPSNSEYRNLMKTLSKFRYLTGLNALAFILLANPTNATDKKSSSHNRKASSSEDKRVQDYKRKIADINQRVAAAQKALGQAAADYKAKVARKEKELKGLSDQYR